VQAMTGEFDTGGAACKDPPWLVRQFAYFKIERCKNRDFDSVKLNLTTGQVTLAGRVMQTDYALTDKNRDPAALAVWKNYVESLQQTGAKLMSDPRNSYEAVLTANTRRKASTGTSTNTPAVTSSRRPPTR